MPTDKKNSGIAVCGSGVGAFLFAPLCQLALTYYDWRGALVLQAGLALNCAVFGALMRPLNVEAETYYDEEDDAAATSSDEKQALLLANKTGDSYELTTNTEPGVQSVNDLNHIKVITPADILRVETILANTTKSSQNDSSLRKSFLSQFSSHFMTLLFVSPFYLNSLPISLSHLKHFVLSPEKFVSHMKNSFHVPFEI